MFGFMAAAVVADHRAPWVCLLVVVAADRLSASTARHQVPTAPMLRAARAALALLLVVLVRPAVAA